MHDDRQTSKLSEPAGAWTHHLELTEPLGASTATNASDKVPDPEPESILPVVIPDPSVSPPRFDMYFTRKIKVTCKGGAARVRQM